MKVCGPCGAWIPDDAVACPNCGKGGKTEPPAPASPAKGRLRTLGALYMAAGYVTLGLVVMSFLQHATGATLEAFDRLESEPGPFEPSMIREMRDLVLRPWYLALTHSVPFLLGIYAVIVLTRAESEAILGR